MVSTKHCSWGRCKSDSRYPEKLHKSLQELQKSGSKVFIPFPKPSQGIDRCQRWINACSRENFIIKNITRNTYICALHWPGEKGPTKEFQDPLKANFTPSEMYKASRTKRKAPQQRATTNKKLKLTDDDLGCALDTHVGSTTSELSYLEDPGSTNETREYYDKETQTEFSKQELSAKVETMILRNEVRTSLNTQENSKIVSSLSYEAIMKDSSLMKLFVGLETAQFVALYDFLNDVCPLNTLTIRYNTMFVYWYFDT